MILDPTPGINSGEGVRGYTALFRSRFEKSLRILALRPDSKRITKITSLKHKSNNAKLREDVRHEYRCEYQFLRYSWFVNVQAFKKEWFGDGD